MIVKNLRESRENLNLKQKEIAEVLNVNYSTVSGWEIGKDTIPLKHLIEYSTLYEFSLDYLFGIMDQNNYKEIILDIQILSKNLFYLRKINNMTQETVSKKLNISIGTYCDYENGKKLISTTSLFGLTTIYKYFSIDELFFNHTK